MKWIEYKKKHGYKTYAVMAIPLAIFMWLFMKSDITTGIDTAFAWVFSGVIYGSIMAKVFIYDENKDGTI